MEAHLSDEPDIKQKLRELQKHYAANLPERTAKLSALWQQSMQAPQNPELQQEVVREFHTLAGSGTSFGFPRITRLAREIEYTIKNELKKGHGLTAHLDTQVSALLAELQRAASDNPEEEAGNEQDLHPQPAESPPLDPRLIYMLVKGREQREEMQQQLRHYGYAVAAMESLQQLENALQLQLPCTIVFSIEQLDEGAHALIKQLKEQDKTALPIIIVSAKDDTRQRLTAVRAGADAFFRIPLDYAALMDTLDQLGHHRHTEPYRILIMDTAPETASYHAFKLQQAGMVTQEVNDPMEIMQHIRAFHPELILMNLSMPACHGTELASIIHQDNSCIGLPIVFLSAETGMEEKNFAMTHGGDDFLNKPVNISHLLSSVKTRAARYRKLRALMSCDNLTGLYNHSSTKELLRHELNRLQRNNSPLSYIIIDIDHFSRVNDLFGFAAGDAVIKTMASLLKQRLRRSDIIGHHGGEAFAVILPDTDAAAASTVIEGIRESFADMRLTPGKDDMPLTFSAGIADSPTYNEFATLTSAALQALRLAKEKGRNRIEIALATK